MWSDIVKLRSKAIEYVDGFPVETTAETEVYANRHSVKSAIFFAAQAAGRQLDIAFTVQSAEYAGQTELEHRGVIYDVVNTYELDPTRTDLNCRRR